MYIKFHPIWNGFDVVFYKTSDVRTLMTACDLDLQIKNSISGMLINVLGGYR